jgi:hypothetical protein
MSNIKISIDKINIRLKGVSPQETRIVSNGLGNQILQVLSESPSLQSKSIPQSIVTLEAGTIQTSRDTSPDTIKKRIAAQISHSLRTVSQKRRLNEP